MKIRVGYELIYDFPQSTPIIMVLGIHFTRASERRVRARRAHGGSRRGGHRAVAEMQYYNCATKRRRPEAGDSNTKVSLLPIFY
jgi:hypothetical protein